jgi:hypothetical protein
VSSEGSSLSREPRRFVSQGGDDSAMSGSHRLRPSEWHAYATRRQAKLQQERYVTYVTVPSVCPRCTGETGSFVAEKAGVRSRDRDEDISLEIVGVRTSSPKTDRIRHTYLLPPFFRILRTRQQSRRCAACYRPSRRAPTL